LKEWFSFLEEGNTTSVARATNENRWCTRRGGSAGCVHRRQAAEPPRSRGTFRFCAGLEFNLALGMEPMSLCKLDKGSTSEA
jgi:hypothetical protein